MTKVSILMTTYNRANFLSSALDSIISQSYKDWELVIVDDCSLDNSSEIIKKYNQLSFPIKYIKNDINLGIVKSRNLALSLCEGEYVAVLDSDDIWQDKDKLLKQVNFLDKNPDYMLCGADAIVIDETGVNKGEIKYARKDNEIRKKILLRNQFVHSSVMYKKNIANLVGGYGNYGVGEDFDLFLKMGLKGKFINLSETVVFYRKHASGITWIDRYFSAKEHLKVIRKYKGCYPNYCLAILKAYLRIFVSYFRLV